MINYGPVKIEGFLKIYDPNNGEVFVDKHNAIHYENMSISLANSLSNKTIGHIYSMAFGNGGASVDPTGVITYLPPNTTGENADLYNQTYSKVVDDGTVTCTIPAGTGSVSVTATNASGTGTWGSSFTYY